MKSERKGRRILLSTNLFYKKYIYIYQLYHYLKIIKIKESNVIPVKILFLLKNNYYY